MPEHVHTYNVHAGNTFCSCGDLNCPTLESVRSGAKVYHQSNAFGR